MEQAIDDFFQMWHQDKQAERSERAENTQILLLQVLTELVMPDRSSQRQRQDD